MDVMDSAIFSQPRCNWLLILALYIGVANDIMFYPLRHSRNFSYIWLIQRNVGNVEWITYADTHPMYTKDNYPNFFRAVPSETAFNPARVALLKYYNWTRVGTLYQNSPRYDLPHSKLLTDLDSARIAIAETQGLVEELQHELLKLKVNLLIT
ncbi:ANF_receptor domain-containing protein [Trichonephila inaurata madagascariensis]|uniref:ANF_receptor domain-containing protein n=1 Tax=Trichonephila inaurata madagascariensis TaxID=2747483 RepID=A0A8X6X1R2_9ARAC|nr:ANF_receptor domain-containing protein [Trichonephila inaurata madagascariensis]